jgi:hypothetical protein
MEPNRSDVISIVVSILGFILAVYGLLTQPLIADSARPSLTPDKPPTEKALTVPARLWDDPLAVYDDIAEYNLPPLEALDHEKSLILFLPVSTQHYQEDRETRLRLRFAVQRALIDQGYTPIQAHLLSAVEFSRPSFNPSETVAVRPPPFSKQAGTLLAKDPPNNIESLNSSNGVQGSVETAKSPKVFRIPIQFFQLRPFAQEPAEVPDKEHYSLITLVWLPDELMDTRSLQDVIASFKTNNEIAPLFKPRPSIIILGPKDSDSLSTMLATAHNDEDRQPAEAAECGRQSAVPPPGPQSSPASSEPLTIVSYAATISDPILATILRSSTVQSDHEKPCLSNIFTQLLESPGPLISYDSKTIHLIRLPGRDDALCREILNQIVNRGALGIHSKSINVWVFTEWDTLYGRSLADTFKSLAAPAEQEETANGSMYAALNELFARGASNTKDTTPQHTHLRVSVIPYLRGLDGTSTLYRKSYVDAAGNKTTENGAIEIAEGTTQFDYMRRLINAMLGSHVPFFPQMQRPDAIVILGTDVYDKLILLKFLRQALQNCAYYTTDLDALYWHPHYLQFTKDLVVASQLPMTLDGRYFSQGLSRRGISKTPVMFRDSYQATMYWTVRRIVESTNAKLNERFLAFPNNPSLYRVGNSTPILIHPQAAEHSTDPEVTVGDSFERNFRDLNAWVAGLMEPIIESASPFWSLVLQLVVIAIGLYAIFVDISKRTVLSEKVRDQIWKTALAFVPSDSLKEVFAKLRAGILRALKEKTTAGLTFSTTPRKSIAGCPYLGGDLSTYELAVHEYYENALESAVTRDDVVKLGLHLFSDAFRFHNSGPSAKRSEGEELEPDVRPLDNYVDRKYSAVLQALWLVNSSDSKANFWFVKVGTALYKFFPSLPFRVLGFLGLLLLVVIIAQPIPFLIGPQAMSFEMRCVEWMVAACALVCTFFVFHRVCYEQWRFRLLIDELRSLIEEPTGLSNRQLALLIADASIPIVNLSFAPCALVFLLFVSHLVPLGGAPLTLEVFVLFCGSLAGLALAFLRLRTSAINVREQVRSTYENDRITALRLHSRLKSFATDSGPMQDDCESLKVELKTFVVGNSTSQVDLDQNIYSLLDRPAIRRRLCDYLESCGRRNAEIVQQLGKVDSGLLAPLAINPILGALLIPIGGAGGITLLALLISYLRY